MYKLIELKNYQSWNDFLFKSENPSFLQSKDWGDFLSKHKPTFFFQIKNEEDEVLFAIILTEEKVKFLNRKYLYSAYGPVYKKSLNWKVKKEILEFFINKLSDYYNNYAYVIFESNLEDNEENQKVFNKLLKTKIHQQPTDSFIIKINLDEEELLARMHHKTRYNIRLAKKKNLKIIWDKELKYFEDWYKIMLETAQRNKIRLLSKKHYKEELENNLFELELAFYNDKLIAGNLISFIGPIAVYVHGGTSNEYRNLMPAYLLQWEAILKAKSKNIEYYDFWGVNVNNKNPNWEGISRFKFYFDKSSKAISYISSRVYIKEKFPYYFSLFIHYLRQIKKFVLTR